MNTHWNEKFDFEGQGRPRERPHISESYHPIYSKFLQNVQNEKNIKSKKRTGSKSKVINHFFMKINRVMQICITPHDRVNNR